MSKYFYQWLKIAIGALTIAGGFSILLVILRTPVLNQLLPFSLFRQALAVHVNLAVLVWCLSIAAAMWSNFITPPLQKFIQPSIYLGLLSLLALTMAAFIPNSAVLMTNYIPVVQNLLFFIGLSSFISTILLMAILLLLSPLTYIYFSEMKSWKARGAEVYKQYMSDEQRTKTSFIRSIPLINEDLEHQDFIYQNYKPAQIWQDSLFILAYTSAIIIVAAIGAGFLSGHFMPSYLSIAQSDLSTFYELSFWGGGHILQFAFTQLLCGAWLVLSQNSVKPRLTINLLLLANLAFSLIGFFGYVYELDNPSHKLFFTWHMKYFAGLVPSLIGCMVLIYLVKVPRQFNYKLVYILTSWFLFNTGGIISLTIRGEDVIIPAHYHGSVVGVTLGLMGFVVAALLEQYQSQLNLLGARFTKLISLQALVYTIGQLLHIIGLAWSGGYGTLRKMPGESLSPATRAAMGLMGLGGLIAVIGGLLFIYICYKIIRINRVYYAKTNTQRSRNGYHYFTSLFRRKSGSGRLN